MDLGEIRIELQRADLELADSTIRSVEGFQLVKGSK